MQRTWAISGVDLHLDLEGTRVRAALEAGLRDAVSSGRLVPGTRLPSSRGLAADLGIARNTVAEAYGQLVAEGWLTARQGSGTRVAARVDGSDADPGRSGDRGHTARHLPGTNPASVFAGEPPEARDRYDLRPGSPDVSAFPRSAWLRAARAALAQAPFAALDYSDPRGRPELRDALAAYLARARGVRTNPDRIVVCSGFTHGFALLCQVLREGGARTLAIEEHGLPSLPAAAAAAGLQARCLAIDEDGAVVDELGDAGAVVLTPAHQFPLGMPLAPRRRAAVVEWATSGERLIIEDDYDGEFRYDRHPVGALQAHAPDRVVYAGTASKTLAPGLRLAWLVVPPALVEPLVAARMLAERHTGVIDQLTLAELIRSGAYDRHIRRFRLAYRRRRDRLVAQLHRRAPRARVSGIAAGLHALVDLPPGLVEDEVIARARDRGLAVSGLASFGHRRTRRREALVVGYAKPPEHAFTGAVARLTAVLADES
ncbi:MAG TPA: PLP-dependent aminotransferase family protein [Solirubrobacteraceae bacterium]|nr:PLP-dependent aminotransferase family protein [Solirubrobacteraceae bacterium]